MEDDLLESEDSLDDDWLTLTEEVREQKLLETVYPPPTCLHGSADDGDNKEPSLVLDTGVRSSNPCRGVVMLPCDMVATAPLNGAAKFISSPQRTSFVGDDDDVGDRLVAAVTEEIVGHRITAHGGDDQDARGGGKILVTGCLDQVMPEPSTGMQTQLDTGKAFSNPIINLTSVVNPGSLSSKDYHLRPESSTTTQDQASSQHQDSKEDISPRLPRVENTTGQGGTHSKESTYAKAGIQPAPGQSEAGQIQTEPGQAQFPNTVQMWRPDVGGRRRVEEGRCQHTRGGYCRLHGAGAEKYFRPVKKTTVGPGGELISKITKKTYYECNLGQRGRGGLRQSQLSFTARRKTDRPDLGGDDTRGGRRDDFSDFSSTNVGQHMGSCTSKEGKDVVDEK